MSSRSRVEQQQQQQHRAVSAERRRASSPSAPRPGTPRPKSSASNSLLRSSQPLWPSASSSSSSSSPLQGESINRARDRDHTLKPVANGVVQQRASPGNTPERKATATPERKRTPVRRTASSPAAADQAENARPADNTAGVASGAAGVPAFRWPSSNSPKPALSVSRSMDLSSVLVQGRGLNAAARLVKQSSSPPSSMMKSINQGSSPARSMLNVCRSDSSRVDQQVAKSPDCGPPRRGTQQIAVAAAAAAGAGSDVVDIVDSSDSESTSSACSSATAVTATSIGSATKATPRGASPSRARQSLYGDNVRAFISELSPALSSGGKTPRPLRGLSVSPATPWSLSPGRLSTPSQPASPSSARASQPPSPSFVRSQVFSPSSRGSPSPTRRFSPFQQSFAGSLSSLINLDTQRGKKALAQQEEALSLRILHNRWLQWRFVNAKSTATLRSQNAAAEMQLYNASLRTAKLHKSVAMHRIKLRQTKEANRLQEMLSAQGPHLATWSAMEQEHSAALSGAMDALEGAVLRVPVTGGARADVGAIRTAMGSAVDVMASLESAAHSLMPKTEEMRNLIAEVADVAKQEAAVAQECGRLLNRLSALEIEERSLRLHAVQRERELRRII